MLTLASALREMFGVQLYKNNARVLLSCILSVLNFDWLQHARSIRGVYEIQILHLVFLRVTDVTLTMKSICKFKSGMRLLLQLDKFLLFWNFSSLYKSVGDKSVFLLFGPWLNHCLIPATDIYTFHGTMSD